MWSVMVPLDRALLSSFKLSIATIPLSVTIWPQILTGGSDPNTIPQISPSGEGPEPLHCYLGPQECPS